MLFGHFLFPLPETGDERIDPLANRTILLLVLLLTIVVPHIA